MKGVSILGAGDKKLISFNVQLVICCILLILLSFYIERSIMNELLPLILEEANIKDKLYINRHEFSQLAKGMSKYYLKSFNPDYNLKLFYKHIIAFTSVIGVANVILYKIYFRKKEDTASFKVYMMFIGVPALLCTIYALFYKNNF